MSYSSVLVSSLYFIICEAIITMQLFQTLHTFCPTEEITDVQLLFLDLQAIHVTHVNGTFGLKSSYAETILYPNQIYNISDVLSIKTWFWTEGRNYNFKYYLF
jgi:hypothetical protein